MLLNIKLERNRIGHLSDFATDVDHRKLSNIGIKFTGLAPVAVRNKAGKIANNYTVRHIKDPEDDDLRIISIKAGGQSSHSAMMVVDMTKGTYTLSVSEFERNKGLAVHLEVSVQMPRK